MLYSLNYQLEGIVGPAGAIDCDRSKLLRHAADIGRTAVDLLGDYVSVYDQADDEDLEEDRLDLPAMLNSEDDSDIDDAISRINDLLQAQRMGYIGIHAHDDLFALVDDHGVTDWASSALKDRIQRLRLEYNAVLDAIESEWSAA